MVELKLYGMKAAFDHHGDQTSARTATTVGRSDVSPCGGRIAWIKEAAKRPSQYGQTIIGAFARQPGHQSTTVRP